MANDVSFYSNLKIFSSLEEALLGQASHTILPDDWWVAISDVVDSTSAVSRGDYKAVNTVAVASIAAVVNASRGIDIPYVFGGDGATFAFPGHILETVSSALRAARDLAKDRFGLTLRVGLVRAGDLLAAGHPLKVARMRLSQHVVMPLFTGEGWGEAERLVKQSKTGDSVRLPDEGLAEADFSGFECRWSSVPSFNGQKVCLIVRATGDDETNLATFRKVIEKIEKTLGGKNAYHPLRPDDMRLSFSLPQLSYETRIRSKSQSVLGRLRYMMRLIMLNIAGQYLFSRKIDTDQVAWSRYRDDLVENTDYRRICGTFHMILDISSEKLCLLESWLESMQKEGSLSFGLHASSEVMVTCLVESYNGNHMHFVDGTEGGYSMAAKKLKLRLAEREGLDVEQK